MEQKNILIVDQNIIEGWSWVKKINEKYQAVTFYQLKDALDACEQKVFDLILTEFSFPGISTAGYLKVLQERQPSARIVLMLTAAEFRKAEKEGAAGYPIVLKKLPPEKILPAVEKLLRGESDSLETTKIIRPLRFRENRQNGRVELELQGELTRIFMHRLIDYLSRIISQGTKFISLDFAQVTRVDTESIYAIIDFLHGRIMQLEKVDFINAGRFSAFFFCYKNPSPKIRVINPNRPAVPAALSQVA